MRPIFGLMNVTFTSSVPQQSALLHKDLTARNHVGDRGHADVEGRERYAGAEHTRSDRTPAVESFAGLMYALGQFVRLHAAWRKDGPTVAVVWIEPPRRRQEAPFGQETVVEGRAGGGSQRIEVRDFQARLQCKFERSVKGVRRIGVISKDKRAIDPDAPPMQGPYHALVGAADAVPSFAHLPQAGRIQRFKADENESAARLRHAIEQLLVARHVDTDLARPAALQG